MGLHLSEGRQEAASPVSGVVNGMGSGAYRAVSPSGDPEEQRRRQEVAQRVAAMRAAVIDPVVAALEDAGAYLSTTAEIDATPVDTIDPAVARYDLAAAERQREIAAHLEAIVAAVRQGVERMTAMASAPLMVQSPEDQLRHWLHEARTYALGRRRFAFSPLATIEVSEAFVLDQRDFFIQIVVRFIQRWEEVRQGYLREEGADPETIEAIGRITSTPSWRALQEVPECELTDEDALTLVAVGCVVGAWETWPSPDQIAYETSITDPSDVPFLVAGPVLLGVVDTADAIRD